MTRIRLLTGAVVCFVAVPFGVLGWFFAKIGEGFIDLGRVVAGEAIEPFLETETKDDE